MRVTRLKKGVALHLTDNEWDVLMILVTACEAGPLPDFDAWSPALKNAYTRQTNKHGQFLAIDRDRRKDACAERAALEVAIDNIDKEMNP